MLQADGLQDMPEQEPNRISNDNIGRCLNCCLTPSACAWKGSLLTVHWHALTLTPLDGQILSHCKRSSCMYADSEHENPIDEPAGDVATTITAAPHQERTPTDVRASADPAAAQAPAVEDEAPAAIQDASDLVASAPSHGPPLQPEPANTPLSSSSPSAESDRCSWHALRRLARQRMCFITAVTMLTHLNDCMRNHFRNCSICPAN
jgi:hypothetical protein